ncbi:MAG TPA: EamA family transporter [Tepidisphaeraceae bacterium]|nr:EamA family transporter [Tepidisphaeraceae bacterium]
MSAVPPGPAGNALSSDSAASRRKSAAIAFILNPYVLILVGALLTTAGEVLLAKGSKLAGSAHFVGILNWLGPLAFGWTWIGIASYIVSLLSWLYVLRFIPLSIAFPLINVVHVLVPVGAHIFLNETVPPRLWAGVGLIFIGALVIARPLMKVEHKL